MSSSLSNTSTARQALTRGGKLIFFLVLLPAFLTGCNLCFTFQRHGILLVESSAGAAFEPSPIGVYWSASPLATSGGSSYFRQEENYNPRKLFGLLPSWPSISQVASSLRDHPPTSSSSTRLEFVNKYGAYCFISSEHTICPTSHVQNNINDGFHPPSLAQWKIVKSKGKTSEDHEPLLELRIRSFTWFKPYYFQKEEKPFQQLVQRPATCLLLALNIGLAFCYWNYRVNPNQVALMDGPILQQFQYWRGITGTLAHFEWWHLLFNMMSLHNLGQFLEEQYYGSINFLLYNLALIPVTVLIFLGGTHLVYIGRLRLRAQAAATGGLQTTTISRPSINAVGYSGVLFAWMVVSSLEQPRSCPIPFMTDLCFDTWHITRHIKFNVGPLIQLVMAQVILPRVSFGGHLAGIIAGFLLHWNLLPLELVHPSVLIPLLALVQWRHRQYVPIHITGLSGNELNTKGSPRNFLDEAGIEDDNDNFENKEEPRTASVISTKMQCFFRTSGVVGTGHLLQTLLCAMGFLLLGSLLMMSWWSSVLYAQGILMALFYYCYQSYIDHWDDEGEQDNWSSGASHKKQRMLVLWKGFIASTVLVLVWESMTLAGWFLMGPAMFSHSWWALSLLIAQTSVHLIALSVACNHWGDIGGEVEEKGIFEYALGFLVLENGKAVGHKVLLFWITSMGCQRFYRAFPLSATGSTTNSRGRTGGPSGRRSTPDRAKLAAAAAERRARAVQESDLV